MRVLFLVPTLRPSGGVEVVRRHAKRLTDAHGMTAEVVAVDSEELPTGDPYDVAVATWWTTADVLWEVPARRRAILVQGLDERHYGPGEPPDLLGAQIPLALPIAFLTASRHLHGVLGRLRPSAPSFLVVPGVDKAVFRPRRTAPVGGPLRVLIDGEPRLAVKGVEDAMRAVRTMQHPVHVTVVPRDPATAGGLHADDVLSSQTAEGMAAAYAAADIVLKTSRDEGLGLGPIEAFHVGVPCVATPYGGHEDYLRHGENGLLVGHGDHDGAAAALDRLAADPDLRARLAIGALATAGGWPDPEQSTSALAEALRAIAGEPGDPGCDLTALLRVIVRHRELGRGAGVRGAADRQARADLALALVSAQTQVEELSRSRAECASLLADSERRLEEVRASRAYRTAVAARRALRRG